MKQFEYKLLTIRASHLNRTNFQVETNRKFATWGKEGWELIKMEAITSGGFFFQGATTREFLIVFKREKNIE